MISIGEEEDTQLKLANERIGFEIGLRKLLGIPIEKQADLFKKFYQVDATLTREKEGSGLGLSICKGIVENHNGIIIGVPNQGTAFTITLPINSKSAKSPVEIS